MMKKQQALGPWAVLMCLTAIFLAGCNIFTCPDKGTVATTSFDPPGEAYAAGQTETISCTTPGATIYYSTDGSDPTLLYTAPVSISETCTLKAVAIRLEWKDSAVANATYTITMPSNWAFVQGGTFYNGTSDVTVSSFYIDKYELTQAAYQAVMGVNPSYFAGVTNGPVEQVSWFNAIEYCNRRSMQEGLTPCYSYSTYGTNPDNWPSGWNGNPSNHTDVSCNWTANGYRLPTEMEWMFAARGQPDAQLHL